MLVLLCRPSSSRKGALRRWCSVPLSVRALSCGWAESACELAHFAPSPSSGVGILLPLALVVCYITRQSQYTSNNVLQMTQRAFLYLTEQKNSLTTRHDCC